MSTIETRHRSVRTQGLKQPAKVMAGVNSSSLSNASVPGNVTDDSTTARLQMKPSEFEIVSQAIVLIAVLIVSVFGNGVVCFLVFTIKQLQIPTNYFILSLALADLLFAVICLPFRIVNVLQHYAWHLGLDACRFWVWLDLLFCSVSIANLAAISVDRYLKIASPLTYDVRMTASRVTLTLIILWGYAIALASLSFVSGRAPGIVVQNQYCLIDNRVYLTVVDIIGFFAPFTIMLLMYCFVFRVAVSQAKKLFHQQVSLHSQLGKRRKQSRISPAAFFFEVKATKTLIILLSVFCVCWSPYFVLSLLSLHSPEVFSGLPHWFMVVLKAIFVHILPNCNAACNPIIYTTHNHQFRKAIQQLINRYRGTRSASFNSYSEATTELRSRQSFSGGANPISTAGTTDTTTSFL